LGSAEDQVEALAGSTEPVNTAPDIHLFCQGVNTNVSGGGKFFFLLRTWGARGVYFFQLTDAGWPEAEHMANLIEEVQQ